MTGIRYFKVNTTKMTVFAAINMITARPTYFMYN